MKSNNVISIGFLFCLFLLGFILLFGLEIKFFVIWGIWDIVLFLIIFYLVSIFVIRNVIIKRKEKFCNLIINNRKVKVKPIRAPEQISNYVKERAKRMNISSHIEVLFLPGTISQLDAYTFGKRRKQFIVLTAGLIASYLIKNKDYKTKFDLIIDHELGHIFNKDTNFIYLAKSVLYSTIILLPIKIILLGYIISLFGSNYFHYIFPPSFDLESYGMFTFNLKPEEVYIPPITSENYISIEIGILLILLFHTLLLFLYFHLYRLIIHLREYIADEFTYKRNGESEIYLNMFDKKFKYKSIPRIDTEQSFIGDQKWHPENSDRIKNLKESYVNNDRAILLFGVIITLLLIAFRVSFGESRENFLELTEANYTISLFSLLFFISSIFLLATVVVPNRKYSTKRKSIGVTLRKSVLLSITSIFISVFIYAIYYFTTISKMYDFTVYNFITGKPITPFVYLIKLEHFEHTLLICSIPTITLSILVCYFLTEIIFQILNNHSFLIKIFLTVVMTIFLFDKINLTVSSPIQEYRDYLFSEFLDFKYSYPSWGENKDKPDIDYWTYGTELLENQLDTIDYLNYLVKNTKDSIEIKNINSIIEDYNSKIDIHSEEYLKIQLKEIYKIAKNNYNFSFPHDTFRLWKSPFRTIFYD